MSLRWLGLVVALSALIVAPAFVQVHEKGGEDETGPYEVVPDWQKPLPTHDKEWGFGIVSSLHAESPDRIYVIVPGDLPKNPTPGAPAPKPPRRNYILVVNRNGETIENWSQWDHLWKTPQYITQNPYDPEKRVWIADSITHQIHVFSNDGKKLIMTLGEADKPGTDETHLNGPADISFYPDGSFIVADGYYNTRIVKFDKNGKYVSEFGVKGSAPGQLDFVHCAAIAPDGRIYACNRRNHRIEVFDQNGKYVDNWPGIRDPVRVWPTTDGFIWVGDAQTNKFLKYDRNGRLVYSWGTGGSFPGGMNGGPHSFTVDREGNLYVGDYRNHRAQKFVPKKNADKSKIIPMKWQFDAAARR